MSTQFSILSDIDGVLHRASRPIPGAARFVADLQKSGRNYLFLTNSPELSPRQLHTRLLRFGMDISPAHFYTSAEALATFVSAHAKRPRVFLIGSRALHQALETVGTHFTERDAEFVVFGTGGVYGAREINRAIDLICKGANFVASNAEPAALTERGIKAGCGALIAPIEKATRCNAYIVGKPNHLMIRAAEDKFQIDPKKTLMIGDGLDTDIDVGIQAQAKTVLVLSGITTREDLRHSAYKPDYVFADVGAIRLDRLP